MAEDSVTIRKVADSVALVLTSRLSTPILLALCVWIGNSVVTLKTDVAEMKGTLSVSMPDFNNRIHDLETWKDNVTTGIWEAHAKRTN